MRTLILADITGNRDFWPVKTHRGGTGRGLGRLLKDEVEQIWAEALHYYKDGETIHLPKELGNQSQSMKR